MTKNVPVCHKKILLPSWVWSRDPMLMVSLVNMGEESTELGVHSAEVLQIMALYWMSCDLEPEQQGIFLLIVKRKL